MAMGTGGGSGGGPVIGGGAGGGHKATINITPMIDVLLVLLILFLVIQPALTKGIDVQVPATEAGQEEDSPDQIVLHVQDGESGPSYTINEIQVPRESLVERVREVFEDRPRKVIFVRGDESLAYSDVVWALDAALAAGIEVIGLVPRPQDGAVAP